MNTFDLQSINAWLCAISKPSNPRYSYHILFLQLCGSSDGGFSGMEFKVVHKQLIVYQREVGQSGGDVHRGRKTGHGGAELWEGARYMARQVHTRGVLAWGHSRGVRHSRMDSKHIWTYDSCQHTHSESREGFQRQLHTPPKLPPCFLIPIPAGATMGEAGCRSHRRPSQQVMKGKIQ